MRMRDGLLRCVLLWVAVIGLMAMIYAFSAQPGAESDALTQITAMPIAELLASMQDGADAETVTYMYIISGTIIRKLAHLCEYALLGLLLTLLCRNHGVRAWWIPSAIGVAYAVSDEVHQLFVPGRTGLVTDVLLDALGVCLGVWLIPVIQKIRRI